MSMDKKSGQQFEAERQGWKRGLPPGAYYEGMVDDFEVYYSPGGVIWHRRHLSAAALDFAEIEKRLLSTPTEQKSDDVPKQLSISDRYDVTRKGTA